MKAIRAAYEETSKNISIEAGAAVEDWVKVCRKFNDDVERICDVTDVENYTGLYACYDDKNERFYYLVEEDKQLFRLKRKHFLDNIGLT